MSKTASESWEVYMVETESGKLYTGITNRFEHRMQAHQISEGARFFNFSKFSRVVFRESHANRSEASKREFAIKQMTRQEKLQLILTFSK